MATIADRIDDDSMSNAFDFKGIDVYREYVENGSTQMHSLLTSAVMAWGSDSTFPDSSTVLTLGSTGDIRFIVDGEDGAGEMTLAGDDKLELTGKYGTHIKGGDNNNTVKISQATFTFDTSTGTNVIDAGDHELYGEITKRNFEFDAKLSEYTGSLQVHGDFITNGHVMSRSLNVAKLDDSNVSTGFGFRVTDRDALELYKYDSFNNYTQRIAIFGDGAVFRDDAYSNFPIFGASNYGPNDQLVLGGGGSVSIWETSGANIFYNNGTVVIGADVVTENVNANNYDLEVYDRALFHSGLDLGTDGEGIKINHSTLENVQNIQFCTVDAGSLHTIDTTFTGTLSSIYLDRLPANYQEKRTSDLWFLTEHNSVEMYSFHLGTKKENNIYIANNHTLSGSLKPQFTLGHLFHGQEYKDVINSDNYKLAFNASIDGNYPPSIDLLTNNAGMGTVWFDQIQNDVELRNFKEDSLDSLDKLTIKSELSVSTIHFTAIEDEDEYGASNAEFDGTISTLLGVNTFRLTNFVDDIDTKQTLTVTQNLTVGTIGHITPFTADTRVGTTEIPFHTGNFKNTTIIGSPDFTATFSSTTLSDDTEVVTINKPLQITDPAGIILADGSPLNSLGVEGDKYTTFDYVSLGSYKDNVYRVKGDITFKKDRPGTPSTQSTKLYIYEIKNDSGLITPNDVNGTYFDSYDEVNYKFDLKNGTLLYEQNLSTVDINLTDEAGNKRKKVVISTFKPKSINDLIDLNIYIPDTDEFKHKFFVDFNYYHNDEMLSTTTRTVSQYLPFGYLSGELTVFNKTKYLNLNQSEDTNKHLIQFISYFDVPVADIEDIESNSNDDSNYFYFAPKETTERIGGYYTYFDGEENISLSDNFLMYPKITFRNWKNDRNSTSFEVVPYDDWDLVSDMGIVNPNKIDWEWKRKLMELTLSYIKYGKPGKLTENDQIKIDNVVDAIWNNPNSYSIVSRNFNGSYIIIAIRFNKTIFDPSSGVDINIIEVA